MFGAGWEEDTGVGVSVGTGVGVRVSVGEMCRLRNEEWEEEFVPSFCLLFMGKFVSWSWVSQVLPIPKPVSQTATASSFESLLE